MSQEISREVKAFLTAAKAGDHNAQHNLGIVYRDGLYGTTKNLQTAIKWFSMAANNDIESLYNLGCCYKSLQTEEGYTKAFECFLKAAKKGYVAAQYNLAISYLRGQGVKYNPTEAFFWLKKSSAKGDLEAYYNLATCLQEGTGTPKNLTAAFENYTLAANKGHIEAAFYLAECYDYGIGVDQDKAKAKEWYKKSFVLAGKAAQTGDVDAQYLLAKCYHKGKGILQNDKEAFKCFLSLAKKDHAKSAYQVGIFYQLGKGTKHDEKLADTWFKKAFNLLLKEAQAGDAGAQNDLGLCYERGRGTQQNHPAAFKCFQAAAEKGCTEAQYSLGLCYYFGEGVKQDSKIAVKWWLTAAEKGDDKAANGLGACYRDGDGIQQDYQAAVQWFLEAAKKDNAKAINNLADCYKHGKGITQNLKLANQLFKKAFDLFFEAAQAGNIEAQNGLGCCYRDGEGVEENTAKAFKWFSSAAKKGDANAQNNLGCCYRDGEGVEENSAEAFKWFLAGAQKGNAGAQYNLGCCYYNGKGVEKELKAAFKWSLAAAKNGEINAQNHTGCCYKDGEGVEQDPKEACKWFLAAAEKGDANAQYNLACCYKNGEGVEENLETAFKWFLASAKQGDEDAQYEVGLSYAEGEGVKQSIKEARRWLRQAADKGHVQAKKYLKKLPPLSEPLVPAASVPASNQPVEPAKEEIHSKNQSSSSLKRRNSNTPQTGTEPGKKQKLPESAEISDMAPSSSSTVKAENKKEIVSQGTALLNSHGSYRSSEATGLSGQRSRQVKVILNEFKETKAPGDLNYAQQVSFFKRPPEVRTPVIISPSKRERPEADPLEIKNEIRQLSQVAKDKIGRWGEACVFNKLRQHYKEKYHGKVEETSQGFKVIGSHEKYGGPVTIEVIWHNKESESYKEWDLEIVKNKNGKETVRYVEVKTTTSQNAHKAFFSNHEWRAMLAHKDEYVIYRVFGAGQADAIKIEKIKRPLEKILEGELELRAVELRI